MEGKVTYTRLKSLYKKIQKSISISDKKQKDIEKLEKKLYKETRPAMVDVHKQEISIKKNEKAEFDEMTKEALLDIKKQILILSEKEEKNFQKRLLDVVKKRNENKKDNVNVIKEELTQTKEQLEEMKEKMDFLKDEHEKILNGLNIIEKDVNRLAIEFDIYEEMNKITIDEAKETEREAMQRAKEERKKKIEEKERSIRTKEEQEKIKIKKEEEENDIKKEEEFKRRLKELQEKEIRKNVTYEEYLDEEYIDEEIDPIKEMLEKEIEDQEDQEHQLDINQKLNEEYIKRIEEEFEKGEEIKFEPIDFKTKYSELDTIKVKKEQENPQTVNWESIENFGEKEKQNKNNIGIEDNLNNDMNTLKVGSVKKGLYVSVREKINKIINKLLNFKNKLLLAEGKKENIKYSEVKSLEGKDGISESQKFREIYNASVDHNQTIKNLEGKNTEQSERE